MAVLPVERRIHADSESLYRAAVDALLDCAQRAIAERGVFRIALSGGGTPQRLYELLATPAYHDKLDWSHTHVFFGDERCVPPDQERSNFRMASDALLDKVSLPVANVHRMHGEDDPLLAAHAYALQLRREFHTTQMPRFDLILLGLGDNGHTASLFPGGACLQARVATVCAQYVESQGEWRLTLTIPTINAARAIWVLAIGASKAPVVEQVLEGVFRPDVLPMQYIAPTQAEFVWWLDTAAAAQLGGSTR
ncbi:MAG: 6-phosphogluconolactonase [Rudaea sp.]